MRIRQVKEKQLEALPQYDWTNRIMDTDLVTIIVQILSLSDAEKVRSIYLATDYAPVTSFELTSWLATELNSNPPTLQVSNEDKPMSGKRLHSNIPLDWLQYPDWQSGYAHILKAK